MNPRIHLIKALQDYLLRITMSSTLAELSGLEISPPPSPPLAANKAAHTTPSRNAQPTSRKQKTPSKFENSPPDPQYYFEDGLRRVPPYNFTYNTYCKERWRGKTLSEVFLKEFRDRPEEYYVGGCFFSFQIML
jgi:tRNA pseudouridine synthase 9